jgi:AP endonuclease-2
MKFFRALEMRWKEIVEGKKVHVIVVGDFNIAPQPIDYPDVDLNFYRQDRPDRMWMKRLLQGGGFSDCFRVFHPERKNAFTVWSLATGARQNNYGSRIDLCLSNGMCFSETKRNDWCTFFVSGCDIHPSIMGSDHCPVSLDIEYSPDYAFPCSTDIPETEIGCILGKKQMKISLFLGKRLAAHVPGNGDFKNGDTSSKAENDDKATKMTTKSQGTTKRQATLKDMLASKSKRTFDSNSRPESPCPSYSCSSLLLEKELAAAKKIMETNRAHAKDAWGKIQDKMKIPNCKHGIAAALKRVSKQGPNQGRYFYSCSLPKGHGPEGQCGFFQWVTSKRNKS